VVSDGSSPASWAEIGGDRSRFPTPGVLLAESELAPTLERLCYKAVPKALMPTP
jgi:hypothetical protein